MIDRVFSISSFLALRYIVRKGVDFTDILHYRYPEIPSNEHRILVGTADEIDEALTKQIDAKCKEYSRVGILLSGGMDSSILASYLTGKDAYTFRFLGGRFQVEELRRAEMFARKNNMVLHYVDIDWNTVTKHLKTVMVSKGGPVHSIEPQIYQAAIQAKIDGIELMIIGDASDYIFGGMDRLLSKDWSFDEFVKRYIYVDPFEVLKKPISINYVFEKYRYGENIDFIRILEELATQESYGSYDNAFYAAGLDYFDPYERLKMTEPLDLKRIRAGDSKYLIRELFKKRYPNFSIPEKVPMPRPVDLYFENWKGPHRLEFKDDIFISKYDGNQRWLMWCLEQFLDMIDEGEKNYG